jgi:inositol 3-alpha-galactosyltransferase
MRGVRACVLTLLNWHSIQHVCSLISIEFLPPQDFLNMFFRDQYRPIPNVYNLVLAMLWRHPENVQLEKVKVVHYCAAGSKPWRFTGKEANMDREDINALVSKWWDIYNDETLDLKGLPGLSPDDDDEVEAVAKKPLRAALAEAGTVKYVTAPSAA